MHRSLATWFGFLLVWDSVWYASGNQVELIEAVTSNDVDTLQTLISNGADVHVVDDDGCGLLHTAVKVGAGNETISTLLGAGVELNSTCSATLNSVPYYDATLLHAAAMGNDTDLVSWLADLGLDINAASIHGDTLLHFAAFGGNVDMVQYLIGLGLDINAVNSYGETLLDSGAFGGNLGMVQYLVDLGLDINAVNNNGRTLLHSGARGGNVELVQYLISLGLDISAVNNYGRTILHFAARSGSLDVLQYLVSLGLDIHALHNGETILHSGGRGGNVDMVQYLISLGLDINALSNDGRTLLHYAAHGGNVDLVQYLISLGLDIHALNNVGETLLHYAARSGSLDVLQYLVSLGLDTHAVNSDGVTLLHLAARYSNVVMVQYLISLGLDIDAATNGGETLLHWAARYSNVDMVQYLISLGLDIDAVTNGGGTLLHWAALGGNVDMVQYLVDLGLDIHAVNNGGRTLLHFAAEGDNVDMVQYLVDLGLDIHAVNNGGETLLHFAARYGNVGMAQYLVDLGLEYIHAVNNGGETALHLAARNGNLDMAQYLISLGLDIDAVTNGGETLLHQAISGGNLDMVQYLVDLGLDIHAVNNGGETLLHFAARYGNVGMAQYLVDLGLEYTHAANNGGGTALHEAARNGNLDMVQYLVDLGLDIHAVNNNGSTLLHWAARCSNVDMVQYLISLGLDIDAVNNGGGTLLHWAALGSNVDMVQYLVDLGLDTHALNNGGRTLFHFAAEGGNVGMAQYLVDLGLEYIHAANNGGGTALHEAARNGNLDMVQYLVDLGLDIHAVNNGGRTLFHFAAEGGNVGMAQYLVDLGLEYIHAVNNGGETALHEAARNGNLDMVQYLVDLGLDINAVDSGGKTLLHWAASNGNLDMVQYLLSLGINIDAVNSDGLNTLNLLQSSITTDQATILNIVKMLVQHNVSMSAQERDVIFFNAVSNGDIDFMKDLLDLRGASINATFNFGRSALHVACDNGDLDTVQFLLDRGANLDATDNSLKTPLHYVVAQNVHENLDVIRILLQGGSDPHATDSEGLSPFHLIAGSGDLNGIDLVSCNRDDRTLRIIGLLISGCPAGYGTHGPDPVKWPAWSGGIRDVCSACPPGHASNEGSGVCVPCKPGSAVYLNVEQKNSSGVRDSCKECPQNFFASESGRDVCVRCAGHGSLTFGVGSRRCVCSIGYHESFVDTRIGGSATLNPEGMPDLLTGADLNAMARGVDGLLPESFSTPKSLFLSALAQPGTIQEIQDDAVVVQFNIVLVAQGLLGTDRATLAFDPSWLNEDLAAFEVKVDGSTCQRCPAGMTTETSAVDSASECKCPAGTFRSGPGMDAVCVDCSSEDLSEGLDVCCGEFEDAASVCGCQDLDMCKGAVRLNPGFMIRHRVDDSHQKLSLLPECAGGNVSSGLFRCGDTGASKSACPGGFFHPYAEWESNTFLDASDSFSPICSPNRDLSTGTCSLCLPGYILSADGSSCDRCGSGNYGIFVGFILGVILMFWLYFHRLSTSKIVTSSRGGLVAVTALTTAVTQFQAFQVLKFIDTKWPSVVLNIIDISQLFTFRMEFVSFGCIFSNSPVTSVAGTTLALVPCAISLLMIQYKLTKKFGYEIQPGAFSNAVGMIGIQLFMPIFLSIVVPVAQFDHPDKSVTSSLSRYPYVAANFEGEHFGLFVVALLGLLLWVVPFVTWCLWATVIFHKKIVIEKDLSFLSGHRFLFEQFTPECFWFSPVLLLRNTMVVFLPVVLKGNFSFQVASFFAVLGLFFFLQVRYQPSRFRMMNRVDSFCNGLYIFVVMLGVVLKVLGDWDEGDGIVTLVTLSGIAGFISLVIALVMAVKDVLYPSAVYQLYVSFSRGSHSHLARLLSLKLTDLGSHRLGKHGVYFNADPDEPMKNLVDQVKSHCRQVIFLVNNCFLADPRAVGEMIAATQNDISIIPILLDDWKFSEQGEEQRRSMGSHMGKRKEDTMKLKRELMQSRLKHFDHLTTLGMDLNMALEGLDIMSKAETIIPLSAQCWDRQIDEALERILSNCFSGKDIDFEGRVPNTYMRESSMFESNASVFVCAPSDDINALAACALLQREVGIDSGWFSFPRRAQDGISVAVRALHPAKVVVVLMSWNFLTCPECIVLLGSALLMGIPIAVVQTERSFPIPNVSYLNKMHAGQFLVSALLEEAGVSAENCADAMKFVLSSVPLSFLPQSSSTELKYQASVIASRVAEASDGTEVVWGKPVQPKVPRSRHTTAF